MDYCRKNIWPDFCLGQFAQGGYMLFNLVLDVFLIVAALAPLAAFEQWREYSMSRNKR